MTNPDGTNPEDPEGQAPDGDRKLDEDAAWRSIVENYGPEPSETLVEPVETRPLVEPPSQLVEPVETYQDSFNTAASWDDEGHFIPPNPPPLPPLEPKRKFAWTGLFGAPTLMLIAVVLGWDLPRLLIGFLVCWFVAGFGFLVATMPRTRGGDGPDNGAVV